MSGIYERHPKTDHALRQVWDQIRIYSSLISSLHAHETIDRTAAKK